MFNKKNLNQINKEGTPHSSGFRKLVAQKDEVPSLNFEAFTKGYLPVGEKWSMHKHEDIVEICIVIIGNGLVISEDSNTTTYEEGDRFIFPANTKHEIQNIGSEESEFYFVRLKA